MVVIKKNINSHSSNKLVDTIGVNLLIYTIFYFYLCIINNYSVAIHVISKKKTSVDFDSMICNNLNFSSFHYVVNCHVMQITFAVIFYYSILLSFIL